MPIIQDPEHFNSSTAMLDDIPPEYHWEGSFVHDGHTPHLSPFTGGFSPNECITIGIIKPGQQIIEVVKIHGDDHVPCGQRTFVGFLGNSDSHSGGFQLASADMQEAMRRFDDVIS